MSNNELSPHPNPTQSGFWECLGRFFNVLNVGAGLATCIFALVATWTGRVTFAICIGVAVFALWLKFPHLIETVFQYIPRRFKATRRSRFWQFGVAAIGVAVTIIFLWPRFTKQQDEIDRNRATSKNGVSSQSIPGAVLVADTHFDYSQCLTSDGLLYVQPRIFCDRDTTDLRVHVAGEVLPLISRDLQSLEAASPPLFYAEIPEKLRRSRLKFEIEHNNTFYPLSIGRFVRPYSKE